MTLALKGEVATILFVYPSLTYPIFIGWVKDR